jgi:cobalt/nickel transport system permease protein
MLLVRSFERAERVLEAMKLRGFSGHLPMIDHLVFRWRDTALGAGFVGLVILLVLMDRVYVFTY